MNGAYKSVLESLRKIENPPKEVKEIIEDRLLDLGCPFCQRTESIPEQMYHHIISKHKHLENLA